MTDKKRKSRDGDTTRKAKRGYSKSGERLRTKSSGPRLPPALMKHLDNVGKLNNNNDSDDEVVNSDEGELANGNDVYEYEEEVAEEESKKNQRFDPVANFIYQLPDNFKDEDILSDDGDDSSEGEDNDTGRHLRMLQDITGMPIEAFEGKKKRQSAVVSEAYPESEFNPSRDVLSGNDKISVHDLLDMDTLRETSNYSKLTKRIQHVDKKEAPMLAPLPKPEREKADREVTYEFTKKEVSKWEPTIKIIREAPTIYFDKTNDNGLSVGAIASDFKPRTDFEKTIASLRQNSDIVEAYKGDGAKILELKKVSVEEVKDRQARLAKMRSLLFRHEITFKRIKKIKSKTYHRLKKKDRVKGTSLDLQDAPNDKELVEKQERERAEARMTLRHKNQGKWAKRILERGLTKQDEGTRAAISEQLHTHNLLTRKMNSMKDSSSSDDSSNEDDDAYLDSSDEDGPSKLLAKAKEKTIKLLEQENEVPDSGVLSLPFMVRGLEKRKDAATEEAKRALDDYELSLNQQDKNAAKGKDMTSSGRRVFGASKRQFEVAKVKQRSDVDNYGSDSEDIIEENDTDETGHLSANDSHKNVNIDLDVLREDLATDHDSVFKSVEDVVDNPGPRTTYEVSVFASGSWKKMNSKGKGDPASETNAKIKPDAASPSIDNENGEEVDEDSDTDSAGQMIDGVLSSGTKETYKLPTNEELIQRAFAGDDVEMEFEKDKGKVLDEENPEPEMPVVLPGWGEWTNVQKKKGMPSWMLKKHADGIQKRKEALEKRKDAHLKHVIISEKVDKKTEKLHVKTLPYPFTSKEVYEQSIRMPIGPEFNPVKSARALTRPEVVKQAGVIINPIKFQEVDPHQRGEEQKQGGQRRRPKNKTSGNNKAKDSKKAPQTK